MTGSAGHLRTVFTSHGPKYHALREQGSPYSPLHPTRWVVFNGALVCRWGNRCGEAERPARGPGREGVQSGLSHPHFCSHTGAKCAWVSVPRPLGATLAPALIQICLPCRNWLNGCWRRWPRGPV